MKPALQVKQSSRLALSHFLPFSLINFLPLSRSLSLCVVTADASTLPSATVFFGHLLFEEMFQQIFLVFFFSRLDYRDTQ